MSRSQKGRPDSRWSKRMFQRLVERDGPTCSLCGLGLALAPYRDSWGRETIQANLEVDHRLPLVFGGANEEANLWLLCKECHKNKTLAERKLRATRRLA